MTEHVKIYGVKPRIQYVADGILTVYEFPFAIFKTSDIDVYFGETKQDTSTYTVSEARHSDGGTVAFETAPESGTVITIVRNLSIERTSDFQEGSTLRAKVLNDEFDYQIACQQQIAENLNRSMVLPPYATDNDLDLTLPTPSAGKAIVWNSDGTNLENSTVEVNALESTLNGYKTAAQTAATTATAQAQAATNQAQTATTQAEIATAKAELATQKATEVSEALSTKTNIDMDNLSTSGKKVSANLAMPSSSAVSTTFISTGISNNYTYTSPSNGYFTFGFVGNSSGSYVVIYRNNSTEGKIYTTKDAHLSIACAKGDTIKVTVADHALSSISWQKFYYTKGDA